MTTKLAALSAIGCAAACAVGCAQPKYDATLGVSGVPVDDGALAGSFARASQTADIAHLPALGDQAGGGQTFALVVRTWDASTATYSERDRDCHVIDFDVAGLHTDISDRTARSVPAYEVPFSVDHASGAIEVGAFRELWGLRDLAVSAALPTSPTDAHVDDMDHDGNPGATVTASGLASGEIFVVQRKTLTMSGVTRSADESFGLLTHKKEGVVLDATNALLKSSAPRDPDPDPKESWWHEVRVPDGATCDDVVTAVDGNRPF